MGATVGLRVLMPPLAATPQSSRSMEACELGVLELSRNVPLGPSNAWNPSGPPRPALLGPELPTLPLEAPG